MDFFALVPKYVAYKLDGEELRKFKLELVSNEELYRQVGIAIKIREMILIARKNPKLFEQLTEALIEE
jgi:hypothetical protein